MDEQANSIIGLILALAMGVFTWVAISKRERQLDDPNDDSVIYLDQLLATATLQSGVKYLLRVLSQSGNLKKDDQMFNLQEMVIKAAISTFKRAKIEYALITKNTNVGFFFRRPYYHHGGSAEGKKIGSFEIYVLYSF